MRRGGTRSRGLQVLPGQGLDLGLRNARIEPRLDERRARLVERDLRAEHVEERGRPQLVASLLDAKIFFRGSDGRDLNLHTLFGAAERAQILRELLLRRQPRVAELRLRDVLGDPGANDLLFARALVEEGEVQGEAHRLGVRIIVVAPPEASVQTCAASVEPRGNRRDVQREGASDVRLRGGVRGLRLHDGRTAERECGDFRAVGVELHGAARVFGRRGNDEWCSDEPRERCVRDVQVVARLNERQLRVADLNDRPERIGLRGRASGDLRGRGLQLLGRLVELCLCGGFHFTRGEHGVVLLLHVQRDVVLLEHLVRFGRADVRLRGPKAVEPRPAVEQVDAHTQAAVVLVLRDEIRDGLTCLADAVAALFARAGVQTDRRNERHVRCPNRRRVGPRGARRLHRRWRIALRELDRLVQRNRACYRIGARLSSERRRERDQCRGDRR